MRIYRDNIQYCIAMATYLIFYTMTYFAHKSDYDGLVYT